MPRSTRNSTSSVESSRRNTRNTRKTVSFEEEQGDIAAAARATAAATAREKKKKGAIAERRRLQAAEIERRQERRREEEEHQAHLNRMQEQEQARRHAALEAEEVQNRAILEQEERDRIARQEAFDREFEEDQRRLQERREELFPYTVKYLLKAQYKSIKQAKCSQKFGDSWNKSRFDINGLLVEIQAAMDKHNITHLSEIKGWIKACHGRASRQYFTLDELSEEQWEGQVENIATGEWRKYTGAPIDVSLECTGPIPAATTTSSSRRSISAVDSPSHSPQHRRTRTDRLEESHIPIRDRNEALGDLTEELITRWKCHAAHCNHKGMCYIDSDGQHYRINAVQRERWAVAIQNSEATKTSPPVALYRSLINQGVVNPEGRTSQKMKKGSDFEELKDIVTEQTKLSMLKSIRSMADGFQQQQQQQQPYYQPPAYPPYQLPAYPPYQPPSSVPTPPPPPPPLPPSPPEPQQTSRSSPIDDSADEDDILESFWQWKKQSTSKASRKLQYCAAQSKIEKEMWTLDDLKHMSDPSSDIYKYAISIGLPDGLIRSFKKDLSAFKGQWRTVYRHAYILNSVRHEGEQAGGFEA